MYFICIIKTLIIRAKHASKSHHFNSDTKCFSTSTFESSREQLGELRTGVKESRYSSGTDDDSIVFANQNVSELDPRTQRLIVMMQKQQHCQPPAAGMTDLQASTTSNTDSDFPHGFLPEGERYTNTYSAKEYYQKCMMSDRQQQHALQVQEGIVQGVECTSSLIDSRGPVSSLLVEGNNI